MAICVGVVRRCLIFGLLLAALYLSAAPIACAQQKELVGWLEKVRIMPEGLNVHAMLDTGADSSYLNVDYIKYVKKGERKMIRFQVANRYGEDAVFTLPYETYSFTTRGSGVKNTRPIVRLGICVGNVYFEEKVALREQSRIEYQMSLGRGAVSGRIIIDPSNSFSLEPDCVAPQESEPDETSSTAGTEEAKSQL